VTFRAPPDGVLRLVRLDAMTAIYDRRSGATHLVAEVVPTILAALGAGEADLDVLIDRLWGLPTTPDLPAPDEDRSCLPDAPADAGFDKLSQAGQSACAALSERLEELVTTGLIERA
jgi:hypothetical protein